MPHFVREQGGWGRMCCSWASTGGRRRQRFTPPSGALSTPCRHWEGQMPQAWIDVPCWPRERERRRCTGCSLTWSAKWREPQRAGPMPLSRSMPPHLKASRHFGRYREERRSSDSRAGLRWRMWQRRKARQPTHRQRHQLRHPQQRQRRLRGHSTSAFGGNGIAAPHLPQESSGEGPARAEDQPQRHRQSHLHLQRPEMSQQHHEQHLQQGQPPTHLLLPPRPVHVWTGVSSIIPSGYLHLRSSGFLYLRSTGYLHLRSSGFLHRRSTGYLHLRSSGFIRLGSAGHAVGTAQMFALQHGLLLHDPAVGAAQMFALQHGLLLHDPAVGAAQQNAHQAAATAAGTVPFPRRRHRRAWLTLYCTGTLQR